MTDTLVAKVLVLDNSADHLAAIRTFCDANRLVGLKVRKNRLMSVLRANVDLGAILLAEDFGATADETAEIALKVHTVRPELPIILRRNGADTLDDLPETLRKAYCAAFTTADMPHLKSVIDEYIFSVLYPNALVRGILEITEGSLAGQFPRLSIRADTPYVVRDRVIFGEVFSLIPLESTWCRGYMMLQTEETPILELLNRARPDDEVASFRAVNSLLGEITNLIWGGFKNRYIGDETTLARSSIQVPLVVNHKHKYISFGSEDPQLCFLYTLTDDETGRSVRLYQRFVFNLAWAPEDFKEIAQPTDELVESGELELF